MDNGEKKPDDMENGDTPVVFPDEGNKFDIKRELFDWSEALVKALLVVVILFAFFVRSIGVEGTSMYPTLNDGDYIIVSEIGYTPKAGDIVVLTKRTFMTDSIVKRIIATGGQLVDIDFNTGNVWVDGELLDEQYIFEPTFRRGDVKFPIVVPPGSIFVMGDNRNNSTDSRYSSLGVIDENYIVGKVILRVWPLSNFGLIKSR